MATKVLSWSMSRRCTGALRSERVMLHISIIRFKNDATAVTLTGTQQRETGGRFGWAVLDGAVDGTDRRSECSESASRSTPLRRPAARRVRRPDARRHRLEPVGGVGSARRALPQGSLDGSPSSIAGAPPPISGTGGDATAAADGAG